MICICLLLSINEISVRKKVDIWGVATLGWALSSIGEEGVNWGNWFRYFSRELEAALILFISPLWIRRLSSSRQWSIGKFDRLADRRNDRQTDRPTDRQTDRPTLLQTDRPTDCATDRPIDCATDRPTDSPTLVILAALWPKKKSIYKSIFNSYSLQKTT